MRQRLERIQTYQPSTEHRWCPHDPTAKQGEFLACDAFEALYGGAAAGGKTDALLMAALEYVDHPRYRAVIFRRTFPQLDGSGGLIERALQWLGPTAAEWNKVEHRWVFPSGATLVFRHLQHEHSKYDHQGAEYHFVGYDELTQFLEPQYRYLISRVRRTVDDDEIPLRVRSTSNPGGIGHEWVKRRFLDEATGNRVFIPARIEDNPHVDREEYTRSLNELHPLERAQLLHGDWDVMPSGDFFQREWFRIVDQPPLVKSWVRYWDIAATEAKPGRDPDYTVGALVGERDGIWYVKHIVRFRGGPERVEKTIAQTAEDDGKAVAIRMEQEPGASGKSVIDHYARRVLKGYDFQGIRSTGDKATRAAPVASAAEQGNVRLVRGDWITAFLDEATAFPLGAHDDQVDAVSGAVAHFRPRRGGLVDHRRLGLGSQRNPSDIL